MADLLEDSFSENKNQEKEISTEALIEQNLNHPWIDDIVTIEGKDGLIFRIIDINIADSEAICIKPLEPGKVNEVTCQFSQITITKRGKRFLRYKETMELISGGDKVELPKTLEQEKYLFCADCNKTTKHTQSLYNPDNELDGKVWQCSECLSSTDYVSE